MAIRINIDKFDIQKSYILADELELWLLLDGTNSLSRSEVESLIISEKNNENIIEFDEIWKDVCQQFSMRVSFLPDYYPFNIEEDKIIFKKEEWETKSEYKLYLNLLVASRLRFLDKSKQTELASAFEKICKIALQNWLPDFDCKLFSHGSEDRQSFFDTNLRDAFVKLANFIQELPNKTYLYEKNSNNNYKLDSSGDKGLDLVGVKKFPDQERGAIVIFGQCTAKSQGFEKKVLEANTIRFTDYMNFSNNPINMVFIPAFYRESDNDFSQRKNTESCLLVDRQRLLSMIKPECISKMPLSSFELT